MGNICKKQIVSRGKVTNRTRAGRGRGAGVSVRRPAGACPLRLMILRTDGITGALCVMQKKGYLKETNIKRSLLLMILWTEGITGLHRRVMRKDCHQCERISVSELENGQEQRAG